ncbi:MAG: DoxX family protein [Streptosporangiaceae bacterium]
MAIVRSIARPMLAAVFVTGGLDALRNPGPRAKRSEPVTDMMTRSIPNLPRDPETLVRINAAVHIGTGVVFALGKFPRLTPLVLAATLVPTTLGGHRFWEEEDAQQRAHQRTHFLKNTGLLGGLLFAAAAGKGRRRRPRKSARRKSS